MKTDFNGDLNKKHLNYLSGIKVSGVHMGV